MSPSPETLVRRFLRSTRPNGSSARCRHSSARTSRARPGRGGAAQPRAGPPRPARERRVPRREADLRAGRRRGRAPARASGIEFSAGDPLPAEPSIRGRHNRENAAAATAAARAAGIDDEAIARALSTFPGIAHRLEPVGEAGGVRFVNDSKATNVAAALRALEAYSEEPVHLILGGSLKGEGFAPLAAAIGANVISIHLVGEAAPARGRDRRRPCPRRRDSRRRRAPCRRGREPRFGRPPEPCLRELRPVRQLPAPRRALQAPLRAPGSARLG